jgi:purine nucleosidase
VTRQTKMLVDTDAGVDDILALFILLQSVPESSIDVAVTYGNVPLDQAISNVSLLSLISGLTPDQILRGSSAPLFGEPSFATDVHGLDGLGGITSSPPWLPPIIRPYADLTAAQGDQYDRIIALGPMTNMARLGSPSIDQLPLFIMGGAFEAGGNVTPHAEFNFHSDPAAADAVFQRHLGEIFVVPLDVCNTVILGRKYLSDLCAGNPARTPTFLNLIHQHYMDFYLRSEGIDGCHPHDALAVCAALNKDLFTWARGWIRVLPDGPERGRSLFRPDPNGRHYAARSVDASRFFNILESAITDFTEPAAPKLQP